MVDIEELLDRIKPYKDIIVYGAGNIALSFSEAFKVTNLFDRVKFYAVSDVNQNPVQICNLPVRQIDELSLYNNDALVIMAVSEKYYIDVEKKLKLLGFANILDFSFESMNWNILRGYYLSNLFAIKKEKCEVFHRHDREHVSNRNKKVKSKIFMIKSHLDSNINGIINSEWANYLIPLQVGKSLADVSISEFQDNTGDNISFKNASYCELTGHYWIWKNVTADWVGVCHYRRHFELTESDIIEIENSGYDVVLPVPILNIPNVASIYAKDHETADWKNMMAVLKELHPDYYLTAEKTFNDVYYYGYNMMIARKEIFDSYCGWLFPILFKIEQNGAKMIRDKYQRRYIGFLAERLTSLYFVHNSNKLNILWAYKKFYR